MKILGITHSPVEPAYAKLGKEHWVLTQPAWVRYSTDKGEMSFYMDAGWITDKRSGSAICDIVIPKDGTASYDAVISAHDFCYSGHVAKAWADELLYQGLVMAGIPRMKAGIAYYAVKAFGGSGYYKLGETMPHPYTDNREYEHFYFGR